ncbi:MAG: pyridoxal-phosphate dependent enzyme [Pseudolabrys sp.]|nr:pyridoxal-phosphate dependent enzyme [Pseudolabrys sp.]
MAATVSTALGQRSLGDPSLQFPLYPPLLSGCPRTSGPDMQYPLEIAYDYDKVSVDLFRQPPLPGLQRWAPVLPPVAPHLSLGEGGTALIQGARIGQWVGLDSPIWLKDESRNPTWSHKDRLNYCIIGAAVATGARGIAVASTGNHGASAAAYARRAGLRCVVISTPQAQAVFEHFQTQLGSDFILVPSEERWPALHRIIDETGFMPASNLTRFHTGNPFGPEGYKTIAYELFSQLGGTVPGTVVLPTGYGELLFGITKGFRELVMLGVTDRMPRIHSAEPGVRAPLAHAMARNLAAAEVSGPGSLAAGIACTVSSYRAVAALRSSNGRALTFSESTLVEAANALAREGIWQEYSGAAGLAALREAKQRGETIEEPVVAVLTSTGLKDVPAIPIVSSAKDRPSLDSVVASLKESLTEK